MKLLTVWLAAVFSPIALAAQSSGTMVTGLQSAGDSSPQSTVLTVQPPAALCPVSLRAQHKADGSMVRVDNTHPRGIGQWLHLIFEDTRSGSITQARVTIRGFSNKARITQTAGGDGADAVKRMTVRFKSESPQLASGDVWVPGMTAVTRVDLESVSYANGQVQVFTAKQACQVVPDPFMLVADK
jgi:hypothetical protein